MFRNKPRILFALMLVLLLLGICGSALATSTTVDNLLVTVKSDKSRYDVADTAIVTVEVTNLNDFPVLDVNAEAILGKGLILAKGTEAPPTKEIIIPEEKAQFVFSLSLFEVPALGDNQNMLWSILLLIAGLMILLIMVVLYRKHIKKRILPMLLCVVLVSSILPFRVLAQDANGQLNTVSLNVYFGTSSYPFSAKITYGAIDRSLSLGTFKSDMEFFPAGDEYPVLFTLPVISALTLSDQDVAVYDSDGKRIAYLNDKGQNGDEFAGDYIYSSSAKVSAQVQTNRDYYAEVKGNKSNVLRFYYFDEVTPAEELELQSISNHINDIIAPFSINGHIIPDKAGQAVQAVTTYANDLKEKGILLLLETDDNSVWMKFSSGLELLYFSEYEETKSNSSTVNLRVATFEPAFHEFMMRFYSKVDSSAALIDDTFSNYSFVVNLDNNAVTTSAIQQHFLPNSIIIFDGHGGYSKHHESPFISIGQKYTELKSKQDEADKLSGAILESIKGNALLTRIFFDRHINSLKNSFVILNTCSSGTDSNLANTLLKKGASAVLANTDTISIKYSSKMLDSIIKSLCTRDAVSFQYDTLSEALKIAKEKHGSYDFTIMNMLSGKKPRVAIFGGNTANDFRLHHEVDSNIGTISGKVLLANTSFMSFKEEPAKGAKVSIYKAGSSFPISSTTTDNFGNFTLAATEGVYTLRIDHKKFISSVDTYKSFITQISITKQACIHLGTYTLIPSSIAQSKVVLSGEVINANNGSGIQGVNLIVRNNWNNPQGTIVTKTATNAKGEYSLSLNPGYYTLTAQKNGFVTSSKSITIIQDQKNTDFPMTPASIDDSYRIVLSWGETPRDLDAHVTGFTPSGRNFHVYYQNKSASNNGLTVCDLDVDDTDSYGPETITIKPQHLEPYYYYIYNYSNDDSIANSQARVELFKGNRLINTFHVPVNQGDGRYWNLFSIVNGGIVTNNTVSSNRDISYAD